MAVRPFYLEASIDGRKTDIGSGPRSRDGGMRVNLYQRQEGSIRTAATIQCSPFTHPETGKAMLRTSIFDNKGDRIYSYETEY